MRNLSEEAKRKMYESQKRIHKATLEQIIVYVHKGEKQKYKDLAQRKGVSLNSLIVKLLDNEIANEIPKITE